RALWQSGTPGCGLVPRSRSCVHLEQRFALSRPANPTRRNWESLGAARRPVTAQSAAHQSRGHTMLQSARTSDTAEAAPFGAALPRNVDHSANRATSRTWTPERVDQLRSCIGAGLTCAQIAREIGVTRNAVIGKLNRLGLSRGRAPAAPRPERDGARLRRVNIITQRQILRAVYAEAP